MPEIRYVREPRTYLVKNPGEGPDDTGAVQLLLGARLHVEPTGEVNGFLPAITMQGSKGFVDTARVSARQQLKIFYLDVGQGDAILIEAEGAIVVIDGGPHSGFKKELDARLKQLKAADAAAGLPERQRLKIDVMVITHFDKDHFNGLTSILKSDEYEVGTIYHNGLPRYGDQSGKDLTLGEVVHHTDGTRSISTDLRGLASAQTLVDSGLMLTKTNKDNLCAQFLRAALQAESEGRLGSMKLLVRRDPSAALEVIPDTGPDLRLEVLGPLTTKTSGPLRLPTFHDPHGAGTAPSESHTVNGNSVVLRLVHGTRRFLFGGDLNQPAQAYLRSRYPDMTPFEAEVNKACHHGSSDFDLPFLEAIEPEATVFSSGDNGTYDHPLPDAIGAAARHSSGDFPLVFSTELARETSSSGQINLGHINARCNGQEIVMAQRKEVPSSKKKWYAFPLPYAGPFGHP